MRSAKSAKRREARVSSKIFTSTDYTRTPSMGRFERLLANACLTRSFAPPYGAAIPHQAENDWDALHHEETFRLSPVERSPAVPASA